jgi:16S rRNA (guanine527-N7)-methyltransferase
MLPLFTRGARQIGLHLEREQVERFERYYQLLAEVGQRIDLTADLTYEQVQRRHFLESAALAVLLRREGALPDDGRCSLIDVGTGAGFPGVPIKILAPNLSLTLLEATAKKSTFLRRVLEALGLSDSRVVTGRAEEVAHAGPHREAYHVAVSRAVAPLPALLELTLPFLEVGGLLAAPKGSRADEEMARSGRALAELGGVLEALRPLAVPYAAHPQTVVLVRKASPTPARYPRRPGIPKKRPLR